MANWYKKILAQENNPILPNIANEENEDISEQMDQQMEEENPNLETLTPEDFVEDQEETEVKNEDQNIEEPKGFPEFGTAFQAMRWAKSNHQIVRINYRTLHGNIIVRDIEPHGDFFAQTTHRRNVAVWDDTIGDIRTYILDNIIPSSSFPKGYVFTGKTFSPKFNFSRSRKNLKRRNRERKMRRGII
jgi:hypothetical protein